MTTDTDKTPRQSLLSRILLNIPVLGYLIRCMMEERMIELALLLATIFMAIALAILIWGLPAYTTIVYTLMAVIAFFIFLTTTGS